MWKLQKYHLFLVQCQLLLFFIHIDIEQMQNCCIECDGKLYENCFNDGIKTIDRNNLKRINQLVELDNNSSVQHLQIPIYKLCAATLNVLCPLDYVFHLYCRFAFVFTSIFKFMWLRRNIVSMSHSLTHIHEMMHVLQSKCKWKKKHEIECTW